MQNIADKTYINKIVNIKSEILFREAEDDFYFFYKLNTAIKKLKEAIALTPSHIKSILLYADICFIKGHLKKALALYTQAETFLPDDAKIAASLANCYNSLKNYQKAVFYSDKAIKGIDSTNYYLYSQLTEIKINNLLYLKEYKTAYHLYVQSKKIIDSNSLKSLFTTDYETINEKLKLREKLNFSGLKIV